MQEIESKGGSPMKETEDKTFLEMAEAVGFPRKNAYKLKEVAYITGVAVNTLYEDARAGRIATFVPPGRERGCLVRPDWVDEWLKEGKREAVGWR